MKILEIKSRACWEAVVMRMFSMSTFTPSFSYFLAICFLRATLPSVEPYWRICAGFSFISSFMISLRSSTGKVTALGKPPPNDMISGLLATFRRSRMADLLMLLALSER